MLIYLQKCHRVFDNVHFWFNRHYIDDVEVVFSTSEISITLIFLYKGQNIIFIFIVFYCW